MSSVEDKNCTLCGEHVFNIAVSHIHGELIMSGLHPGHINITFQSENEAKKIRDILKENRQIDRASVQGVFLDLGIKYYNAFAVVPSVLKVLREEGLINQTDLQKIRSDLDIDTIRGKDGRSPE